MFSVDQEGRVSFKKGAKPYSIEVAQREVRTVYKDLCRNKAVDNYAEALAIAYLCLGDKKQITLEVNPIYPSVASSAVRMYCSKIGASLDNKVMYTMDVFLTLDDVKTLKDVPKALVSQLEASGRESFRFMARPLA